MIDDKIAGFRFPTLNERELHDFAQRAGRNFETPQAARELDDVALRLKHMILNDELDMEMMRDIDERAFRPIYRVDFEDATEK